jgi:hypothetical protein
MTSKLFLLYLQWLDQHLPKERPCVLLVDQHESRFNSGVYSLHALYLLADATTVAEALEFAASRNIIILALPARLTWLLQPLDLGVFRAFKSAIAEELALHGAQLNRLNFLATIYPAFQRAFTPSNILGGWRASGLWPFDPAIVLECPEVRKSELRKQYLERARKYVAALSPPASSSSSSAASNSAPLALPAPADAAPALAPQPGPPAPADAQQLSAQPLQQSASVQEAWAMADDIAPLRANQSTRKRKQRGLTSGAQLTAREFIDSLIANPPNESKRDQSAAIWAPGQPHPPKRRAKPKSKSAEKAKADAAADGKVEAAAAGVEQVERAKRGVHAKRKARPQNKRVLDDDGDSRMQDASAVPSQAPEPVAGASSNSSSSSSSSSSANGNQDAGGECAQCQLPCLPSQNTRNCDGCTLKYHVECAGWPLKSSRRKQHFECPACKESKAAEAEARRPRKRVKT